MLILGILIVGTQSCKLPKIELREIKFNPEMQTITERYKEQLKTEKLQIYPGWVRIDTVTTHKINISVLNSKNLPASDSLMDQLALSMACDIYAQVINKDDFSNIAILFQNNKGVVIKMSTSRNYSFTSEEIKKHLEN
jgi:hypothetical protein